MILVTGGTGAVRHLPPPATRGHRSADGITRSRRNPENRSWVGRSSGLIISCRTFLPSSTRSSKRGRCTRPPVTARFPTSTSATWRRWPLVTLTQLGHLGKTYVVTGSEALSYREAAAIISAEIGKPLCFIDGTQDEARERRIREGLPAAVIESALAISAYQRAGGKTVTITTTVADLTGRAPPNIRRIRSRKCCGLPWLDTGVVALSDDRRSRDPAGVVGC